MSTVVIAVERAAGYTDKVNRFFRELRLPSRKITKIKA